MTFTPHHTRPVEYSFAKVETGGVRLTIQHRQSGKVLKREVYKTQEGAERVLNFFLDTYKD